MADYEASEGAWRQGEILDVFACWPDEYDATALPAKIVEMQQTKRAPIPQKLPILPGWSAGWKRVMVLSQCCDLGRDRRIFVADLEPYNEGRFKNLDAAGIGAFKRGEVYHPSPPQRLLVSGVIYLPTFAELEYPLAESVVDFRTMRSVPRSGIQNSAHRVVRLSAGRRGFLRESLAEFFGRIPAEDAHG